MSEADGIQWGSEVSWFHKLSGGGAKGTGRSNPCMGRVLRSFGRLVLEFQEDFFDIAAEMDCAGTKMASD